MKIINFILFLITISFTNAQTRHPNDIRNEVYSLIIKDVKSKNKNLPLKYILIDHSINKYNNISMDSYGIQLEDEELSKDSQLCTNFENVKCVEPLEINKYSLNKIYQNHIDSEYPDFYGIYTPIDKWYSLIYAVAKNTLETEKSEGFTVNIPVKNVYFKEEELVNQILFYQFNYDGNLNLLNYNQIKF